MEVIDFPSGWFLLQHMTLVYCAPCGFRLSEKGRGCKTELEKKADSCWSHSQQCLAVDTELNLQDPSPRWLYQPPSLPAGQINYCTVSKDLAVFSEIVLPWRTSCSHGRGMRRGAEVKEMFKCSYSQSAKQVFDLKTSYFKSNICCFFHVFRDSLLFPDHMALI